MRSTPELLSPCTGVCVSGEEAWLLLTDDSSCGMVLASGIPMACLLLVKLGSDLTGAGRDFGICELGRAQGPRACVDCIRHCQVVCTSVGFVGIDGRVVQDDEWRKLIRADSCLEGGVTHWISGHEPSLFGKQDVACWGKAMTWVGCLCWDLVQKKV